jgi:hypothetical protein
LAFLGAVVAAVVLAASSRDRDNPRS